MPTSQSEIQSLLQDLSGVQTTAQSNVPGAVNNGSPNTVYNTPQSSSPPSPWVQYNPVQGAGGYMPPVTNAYGQWMINKGPQPGSSVDWNQMIQDIAGPMLPTWNIPPPQENPLPPPGGNTPPPVNTGGPLPPNQTPHTNPDRGFPIKDGCVVVESFIDGRDGRAASVKKRDLMVTIDPRNMIKGIDVVTYAETKPQPCVRIRTESGIELECSITAPIADSKGNQVLAPNLKDVAILVMDNDVPRVEYVVDVEDIGNRLVRHITCGNKFFLAGKVKGRYILHHNVKFTGYGLREPEKVTDGNPDWMYSTGGTDYAGQYGATGATLGNIISQSPKMSSFADFAIGEKEPTDETATTALEENESAVKSILGTVGVNIKQAWGYLTNNPRQAAMSLGAAVLTGNIGPLIKLLGGAGIHAIKTPDK